MIFRFCFQSLVIVTAQILFTAVITNQWLGDQKGVADKVNYFGEKTSFQMFFNASSSSNNSTEHKLLKFGDIDEIFDGQDLHYKANGTSGFFQNKSILEEALKLFMMFAVVSELVGASFMRGFIIKDLIKRNQEDPR